jgi:hypothetical protein
MKKKVKIKKSIPKYEQGFQTPNTQLDPTTGLPIQQPQVPFAMLGQVAGTGVNLVGQQDPTSKGYIGTKAVSGALKGAGTGAQIGSMIPGIGTAAGAVIGGAIGGIGSGIQANKDKKDAMEEDAADYFSEQQEIYQNRPDFFRMGGMPMMSKIEVEGPELEIQNGKIMKNFKGQPSHKNGGYTYSAKPNRVIIRGKDAEKYKVSDQFTRNSMEREHILTQRNNEQLTDIFRKGGRTDFKSVQGYQDWLQYMRVTGVAGNTPKARTPVYVRGKKVIPKFNDGGTFKGLNVTKSKPYQEEGVVRYDAEGNPIMLGNRYYSESPIQSNYSPVDFAPTREITQLPNVSANDTFLGTDTRLPDVQPLNEIIPQTLYTRDNAGQKLGQTQPNWNQIGTNAATWAPAVYNAAMAFQKPAKEAPIYNPHETEALNILRDRKIDMEPIRRDLYSQARVASEPLGESQGSYLSRRTQIGANTQKALAEANMKAQDINNQYKGAYAGALDTFGQQRVGANRIARNQDLTVATNQAQYLPKALEEASFLTQKFQQQDRAGKAYKDYYTALAEIEANTSYNPEQKKKAKDDLNAQYGTNYGYQSQYNNQGYSPFFK